VKSATFFLDNDGLESLQTQLRQRIIDAILAGNIRPGDQLPSSRSLSQNLGIARNTVTLTYQQLVADGYLVGRERSGVFVGEALFEDVGQRLEPGKKARVSPWTGFMQRRARINSEGQPPPNWDLHPYPFLDGSYDSSLTPRVELRDAVRAAFAAGEFLDWSKSGVERDDPRLVHEIRTKALPRRGIQAKAEQVLVTGGAREALSLLCQLLVSPGTSVAVEEPGIPELSELLRLSGGGVIHQPVDVNGLVIDERLHQASLAFVTPGCQYPTSVRLSLPRRRALLDLAREHDMLLVEYDLPASGGFAERTAPALKSMDDEGRVIYVADLSDVINPGLALGFIVGDPELIRELRRIQTLVGGGAARSTQRVASFFLSLGHHDALLVKQHRIIKQRLNALRDALNYILPHVVAIDPIYNGSAMWVEGPPDVSSRQLAVEAAKRGVLIEPGDRFYSGVAKPANRFRMGVTGLPESKIRDGVAVLAKVMRELTTPNLDRLDPTNRTWIRGDKLARALSGVRLLSRTAYGDPYEIDILPDGSLIGKSGYAHDDCDTGTWWVEGDFWCRQWTTWSYGEVAKFLYTINGDQVKWYRDDYILFNNLLLVRDVEAAG
jgi:GntR family transcriptional regulator/MocR family aminotransferase